MLLRCRPRDRAISACENPCLRSAESAYLSPGVSWRYVLMNPSLFLAVQEGSEVASSPLLVQSTAIGALLHLVCESAWPNRGLLLTR